MNDVNPAPAVVAASLCGAASFFICKGVGKFFPNFAYSASGTVPFAAILLAGTALPQARNPAALRTIAVAGSGIVVGATLYFTFANWSYLAQLKSLYPGELAESTRTGLFGLYQVCVPKADLLFECSRQWMHLSWLAAGFWVVAGGMVALS